MVEEGGVTSVVDKNNVISMEGDTFVPIIGVGTLKDAENFVKGNPDSIIGTCKMEGLVCRPAYELLDRCGNRIIVKIKWCDYKDLDICVDDK